MILAPPLTAPNLLPAALRGPGHAVCSATGLCDRLGVALPDLLALNPTWNDLPPDNYLRDGGRYRRRRHSCFIVEPIPDPASATPCALATAGIQRAARRS